MTRPPARTPAPRRRWWTAGLLIHVALVALLLVISPPSLASDPYAWSARTDFAGRLALGSPWWLLPLPQPSPSLFYVQSASASSHFLSRLLETLPAVLNLALHAAVLLASSRRKTDVRALSAADGAHDAGGPAPRSRLSASTAFFAAAAAGVLVWAAWLGWDHSASYDVLTRQVESPYVSLQILGCALSVGGVAVLLGRHWSALASAAGLSAGFWFGWTADAAGDDTGLFMIGAVALGFGLLVGTVPAALTGRAFASGPPRVGANR